MNGEPPTPPRDYGPPVPERLSPPRRRDWLGRHTLAALVAGAACAAILGWFLLTLVVQVYPHLRVTAAEIEAQATREAYDDSLDRAIDAATARARLIDFADRIVHRGQGADTPWAIGFREGWTNGWNDAIAAMRSASLNAGAAPDSIELTTLSDTPPRQPESH